jgi:hypothetical protein
MRTFAWQAEAFVGQAEAFIGQAEAFVGQAEAEPTRGGISRLIWGLAFLGCGN